MKIIHKNLCSRPFNAIKQGTKRIEIRANKNNPGAKGSVNDILPGDIIIFTEIKTNNTIACKVLRKELYNSVRELLEKEGTEYTLSSTNDIEEGIKSVESIGDYKSLIKENGVFAIELELIH